MLSIGIDPGKDGAIAFLGENLVKVYDCPSTEQGMSRLLRGLPASLSPRAAIEKQPRVIRFKNKKGDMQVVPATLLNRNYGMWRGILAAYNIPFELVTPARWRKIIDAPKKLKKKERYYQTACRFFPGVELTGPRGGIKDGRCVALLLALDLQRTCARKPINTEKQGG